MKETLADKVRKMDALLEERKTNPKRFGLHTDIMTLNKQVRRGKEKR